MENNYEQNSQVQTDRYSETVSPLITEQTETSQSSEYASTTTVEPNYQQQYTQGGYPQSAYIQNNYYQTQYYPPLRKLHDKRSLLKFMFFSLITFGIYIFVYFSSISESINTAASRYDGRKTMHACLMFLIVAPLTYGIGPLVWYHNLSERIGNELRRRGLPADFSAADFWLWYVLGSFILIGPFVYIHKLSKAMNRICAHYNMYG